MAGALYPLGCDEEQVNEDEDKDKDEAMSGVCAWSAAPRGGGVAAGPSGAAVALRQVGLSQGGSKARDSDFDSGREKTAVYYRRGYGLTHSHSSSM